MNKDLATALSRVHEAAKRRGGNIVLSSEMERGDRELLVRMGWLQEILRGWYFLTRPDIQSGDTTAWYANFWDFASIYLNEKYGSDYCLSAENSIELHIGSPTIPKQLTVITSKGGGKPVCLPFETSILTYSDPQSIPSEKARVRNLQVMTLPFALCKVSPAFFQKNGTDVQIALGLVEDISELISVIATHSFVRAAERIIGAYEVLKQFEKAEMMHKELKKIGMNIKGSNPFGDVISNESQQFRSPYAARITHLWASLRATVIQNFPSSPGITKDKEAYLNALEEIYLRDAYNSLSIEGYHVSDELIQRVLNDQWNPDLNSQDSQERNALAARGYYEAFLEVKKGVVKVLSRENAGAVIEEELQHWFQKLFLPNVQAGIIKPAELLGYRKHQVYIRNSRHVPLPREALFDAMKAFFECLKKEPHAAVRAILGHFLFVYIHPFMDGNGRLGRFIMNAMFASGGYPWTIIQVKNRAQYFSALEAASTEANILPLTRFIAAEMESI